MISITVLRCGWSVCSKLLFFFFSLGWLQHMLPAIISFVMNLGASDQWPFRIVYPAYAHSVELLRYSDEQFLDYDFASMLVDIVFECYPLEYGSRACGLIREPPLVWLRKPCLV
jgi:hypothetical protein